MKNKQIEQKLKNWSEEAINQAELSANGILVDNEGHVKELEKIVIIAKLEGIPLDEVKDLIWNMDSVADKIYNDDAI